MTAIERARERIQPYLAEEGARGAWLVGSASRPFHDDLSDLDLELVVTDEAYEARPPRRLDHEVYVWSWSDLQGLRSTRQDAIRYGIQHAVLLHDPDGVVEPVLGEIAAFPDAVRETRARVHYLRVLFGLGRLRKTRARGRTLDARLVQTETALQLVRLLFVAAGSWPSTTHWTRDELWLLGVPDPLLDQLERLLVEPEPDPAALREPLDAWLATVGMELGSEVEDLQQWAFLSADGRAAFEAWC